MNKTLLSINDIANKTTLSDIDSLLSYFEIISRADG